MRSLRFWLILSLLVATGAFLAGGASLDIFGPPPRPRTILAVACGLLMLILPIAWILIVGAAAFVLRWRVLWLLPGAPLALFWLFFIAAFAWGMQECAAHAPPGGAGMCMP